MSSTHVSKDKPRVWIISISKVCQALNFIIGNEKTPVSMYQKAFRHHWLTPQHWYCMHHPALWSRQENRQYTSIVGLSFADNEILNCQSCLSRHSMWTNFSTADEPSRVIVNHAILANAHNTRLVVAWLSGSALVSINEVTLRRARLVLGWVTVFERVHHRSV